MPVSPVQQPFGKFLRRHRQSAGLTQYELAERANLSVETISALERGINHSPRPDTVDLLADALRLSEDEREDFKGEAAHAKVERPSYHPGVHASAPSDPGPALYGRASELNAVRALLGRPRAGALAFTGGPGIGRTRLLREVRAVASSSGHLVLGGPTYCSLGLSTCEPVLSAIITHLTSLPESARYAALDGCPRLTRLIVPMGHQGQVTGVRLANPLAFGEGRTDLATEMGEMGREVACALDYLRRSDNARSLVLLVDDFQWAGVPLANLLGYLLLSTSPGLAPVHLVCAFEEGSISHGSPAAHVLADLAQSGLLDACHLNPLTLSDATLLFTDVWRTAEAPAGMASKTPRRQSPGVRIPDTVLGQALVCAGGIPFYLVELARAARNGWFGGAGGAPVTVVGRCLRLMDSLPEAPRELLRLFALAGPTVSTRMLGAFASVCGYSPLALVSGVDELCQRGFLAIQGESYVFRDVLLRRVLAASVGPALRDVVRQMVRQGEAPSLPGASGIHEGARPMYSTTAVIRGHSFTS